MGKPKTMMIDDEKYIREADVQKSETIEWNGEKTLQSRWIGKKVLVRSINEGINAGIVVLADSTGVELKNVRRLYYYRPANRHDSWYEGVSESGLHPDSKVSNTKDSKLIVEDYSLTKCTDKAFTSIMEKEPNGS